MPTAVEALFPDVIVHAVTRDRATGCPTWRVHEAVPAGSDGTTDICLRQQARAA